MCFTYVFYTFTTYNFATLNEVVQGAEQHLINSTDFATMFIKLKTVTFWMQTQKLGEVQFMRNSLILPSDYIVNAL